MFHSHSDSVQVSTAILRKVFYIHACGSIYYSLTKIKLITELLNIFKIVLVYSKQLQSFKNKVGFYAQFSFLPVGDYRDLKDPFLIENKKRIKYEVQEQQDSNKSNIKIEYLLILKVLRQPKKRLRDRKLRELRLVFI